MQGAILIYTLNTMEGKNSKNKKSLSKASLGSKLAEQNIRITSSDITFEESGLGMNGGPRNIPLE